MKKILALDLSKTVGYAFYNPNNSVQPIVTGTKDFTSEFRRDLGELGHAYNNWLSDLITRYEPEVVSIEAPFMRGKSTYHLFGLAFLTHTIAFLREKERFEFTPMAVKKRLSGNYRAEKKEMIEAAEKLDYPHLCISSDHEADALGVFLLTLDKVKELYSH